MQSHGKGTQCSVVPVIPTLPHAHTFTYMHLHDHGVEYNGVPRAHAKWNVAHYHTQLCNKKHQVECFSLAHTHAFTLQWSAVRCSGMPFIRALVLSHTHTRMHSHDNAMQWHATHTYSHDNAVEVRSGIECNGVQSRAGRSHSHTHTKSHMCNHMIMKRIAVERRRLKHTHTHTHMHAY